MDIRLTINGERKQVAVEPNTLLSTVLREHLGLTGTHDGCDTSQCGACTIHVDGKPVKSCSMLALQVDGMSVTTIEGLAKGDELHPMQKAFHDNHGLQCGFCTPGMVMAAIGIVERHDDVPSEEVIRHELEGNLCRCTGYQNIVKSVEAGARAMLAQKA